MYFAKVSVNKDIYQVYDDSSKLDEILLRLMEKEWQDKHVAETIHNKQTKENDEQIYKFINVDKINDKNFIIGRLIVIFKDDIALYDATKDDLDSLSQSQLSRAVPFYFDFKTEIVAFVPTQKFGRQKFINYFEELINLIYGEQMFRVFAKNNIGDLRAQIKVLDKISEVNITLIPPNSNGCEYDELFAKNAMELKETNGTKFHQIISAPYSQEGLNIKAGLFQRVINGVAKGYGNLKIFGKDSNGEPKNVNSDTAAPYKKYIKDSSRNSLIEVAEYGRAGVSGIVSSEIRQRLDEK